MRLMAAQGTPESDLKPAYLLLSGCETDMAKRAKSARPSDAEGHYKRSQRLLQKVYGTFETPEPSQKSPRASVSRSLHPRLELERLPKEGSSLTERLERELRSLRKERNEQNALLAELRSAKRKLEADLGYECRGRRRLLKDFDDLQKELAAAQKVEDNALSQVKREVDARRKAEEAARNEKEMRLDLQRLCEQYTALGGLINALRSDGMQPPSL
ncbi:hypothetical protein C0993_000693 [Termitomyces sp. T159_Od127]|nr:hypothetical protein C0993_000693 [Termitomyces sp. T159_Od127]